MSIPYYRFYPGDYDRDTKHLSLMQHGAYRLLIDWYMSGSPLPNDLEKINRTLHATSREEQSAVEYVLAEFFRLDGGRWRHKRCDEELKKMLEISQKAKESVSRREKMREERKSNDDRTMIASNTNDDLSNSHKPITINQEPEKHYVVNISEDLDICRAKKELPDVSSSNSKKESIKSLRAEALKVLEQLNRATGREYQPVPANIDMIVARLREGTTLRELRFVVSKKCHDWKDDEKMSQYLRPATLFNKTKFAQYRGEINFKEIDNAE